MQSVALWLVAVVASLLLLLTAAQTTYQPLTPVSEDDVDRVQPTAATNPTQFYTVQLSPDLVNAEVYVDTITGTNYGTVYWRADRAPTLTVYDAKLSVSGGSPAQQIMAYSSSSKLYLAVYMADSFKIQVRYTPAMSLRMLDIIQVPASQDGSYNDYYFYLTVPQDAAGPVLSVSMTRSFSSATVFVEQGAMPGPSVSRLPQVYEAGDDTPTYQTTLPGGQTSYIHVRASAPFVLEIQKPPLAKAVIGGIVAGSCFGLLLLCCCAGVLVHKRDIDTPQRLRITAWRWSVSLSLIAINILPIAFLVLGIVLYPTMGPAFISIGAVMFVLLLLLNGPRRFDMDVSAGALTVTNFWAFLVPFRTTYALKDITRFELVYFRGRRQTHASIVAIRASPAPPAVLDGPASALFLQTRGQFVQHLNSKLPSYVAAPPPAAASSASPFAAGENAAAAGVWSNRVSPSVPQVSAMQQPSGPAQPYPPAGAQPFYPAGAQPYPPAGVQPFYPAGAQPYPPAGVQPFYPAGAQPYPPPGAQPYYAPGIQPGMNAARPYYPAAAPNPLSQQPGEQVFDNPMLQSQWSPPPAGGKGL